MTFRSLLLSPVLLAQAVADRWLWPALLRGRGARCGRGVRCTGRTQVRIAEGGAVTLGERVHLISRRSANPLQILTPCTLIVRSAGARIMIGDETALSGTVIYAATAVEIGRRVMVGANCTIVDTDFHPLSPEARREHSTRGAVSRPVRIGDDVFIGAGSMILKGTELGEGCVVGAGAVVAGRFPPFTIVAGNPARALKPVPRGTAGGADAAAIPRA